MPIRCKLGFMVNTAMGMVRRSVRKRNSTVGTLDALGPAALGKLGHVGTPGRGSFPTAQHGFML